MVMVAGKEKVMISFHSPEWLFLIPLLAGLAWMKPGIGLQTPVRALVVLVFVLAMSRPVIRMIGGDRDVWLLVDRSESVGGLAYEASNEIVSILERSRKSGDRVFVVDYGRDAGRRDQGDPVFGGGTKESRLGVALSLALAQADEKKDVSLLALTDGYSTEPLGSVGEKLLKSGARLNYRLYGGSRAQDIRVAGLRMPVRVRPGEPYLIEIELVGGNNEQVPWTLVQGKEKKTGVATMKNGRAHVRLTDRQIQPGSIPYTVTISPQNDPVPGNNIAKAWLEVAGGEGILLVSAYKDDPLMAYLGAQGHQVRMVHEEDAQNLSVHDYSGNRLVILNNVPSHNVNRSFLKGMDFFVREQSGAMLMAGGEHSFNSGGYFGSPLQDLLPVSMEMKKDQRKVVVALSFVMDRSGSMSMSAGGGLQKIDLANRGTVEAIKLMDSTDLLSVHVVDTAPHEIYPMSPVGDNLDPLFNLVLRIQSMGGGIYIYEGLNTAWAGLKDAPAGTKHVILFADAADSNQHPGDYATVVEEMRKANVTVSVIALGSPGDCDANLLRDVAKKGGGRIYFSDSGMDLPALFQQETALVARSAFIKEKTPLVATPGWLQISSTAIKWPAVVDGYNLCYQREGAMSACISGDEYKAPLVAFWSRGAGKAAAVTFPLGGDYSSSVRSWDNYGDFAQTLTRWLAGHGDPDGYSLRTKVDGELLTLELLYADSRMADIARKPPVARLEVEREDKRNVVSPVWEKIEPGRFVTSLRLSPGELLRGVVRVGEVSLPFGPLGLGSDAEWAMDARRLAELKDLSAKSGGTELWDMASVWEQPRKATAREMMAGLLWAGLALTLLDALLTRCGVRPSFRRKKEEPSVEK